MELNWIKYKDEKPQPGQVVIMEFGSPHGTSMCRLVFHGHRNVICVNGSNSHAAKDWMDRGEVLRTNFKGTEFERTYNRVHEPIFWAPIPSDEELNSDE